MQSLRRFLKSAAALRHNSLVQLAFSALGLALLYLLWVLRPIEDPSQYDFYHWVGPAGNFYVPFILIILAVWLLITLLLLLARAPGRLRAAIWTALILCIPCVVIKLNIFYHRFDSETVAFGIAIAAALLVALLWRPSFSQRFEQVLAPIATILIFLGLLGAFILCQLSWYLYQGSRNADSPPLHHRDATAQLQPHRLIWIVFDELSYQQTYEHRYPGLLLPAFDALAANSNVFTNATPFYVHTEVVLPGLLAGKPFDKIRTSASREPFLRNEVTHKWQTFNQHDTVFQDALNAGYSTAVAGWYNPYCRIIPAVLDNCSWSYAESWDNMLPTGTVLSNTRALAIQVARGIAVNLPTPLASYLVRRFHIQVHHTAAMDSLKGHAQDYLDLSARSNQLLRDPSYSFVLLHLPVPHPWGIYDRRSAALSTHPTSYIDNLALADKCLAGIVQTLQETNQWNSSTIVLMGDHSWRTIELWRPSPGWTQEDNTASHGGQYDPRPVYLVKLPDQTTGTRIDTPYNTVNTRKLFDALMAHQVNTPTDLATWVQAPH